MKFPSLGKKKKSSYISKEFKLHQVEYKKNHAWVYHNYTAQS